MRGIIFTQTFTTNTTDTNGMSGSFGPFGTQGGFAPQQPFGFGQFRQAPPPAPPKPAAPCPHSVLGVACDIKPAELTRAYRKLAKANHPDIGPDAERDARTRRMATINAAYEDARKAAA